ncbi:MAG: hypothetical protein EBT13_03940 [Rhodobacteraceae bacterium]|jgi:hypothetical protein|nr:hypothetical protein [Paracoccaceae bacterium]
MAAPLELTPIDSAVRAERSTQLALMLARELWVVKDRLMTLEAVLSAKGESVAAMVDSYQPDEALQQSLQAERQRFIAEIMASLEAPGDRR